MIRLSHINPPTSTLGLKVDKYIKRYYNKSNKNVILSNIFYGMCIRDGLREIPDPNPLVPWDTLRIRNSGVIRRARVLI